MATQRLRARDSATARLHARRGDGDGVRLRGMWEFIARDPDGRVKWREYAHNIVTNVGLDHALDVTLSGGTPDTTWFVGLTDGTPTVAAGDTMVTHAGWVEVTAYSEATREAFVEAGVSGQSISNTAAPAQFTINADTTVIGGAFLAADSAKGGTAGILFSVVAFTAGDKSLDTSDTLDVTYTVTAADDGV